MSNKHPFLTRIIANLPDGVRDALQKTNPGNGGADAKNFPWSGCDLVIGRVTSSYAGAGTCQVSISSDNPTLSCVVMSGICGFVSGYGTVLSTSIPEGATVLVFRASQHAPTGYVIGCLPEHLIDQQENTKSLANTVDMEPSAGLPTEDAYSLPLRNRAHISTQVANGGRPIDDVPGASSFMSEHAVGLRLGMLMTALRAGSDAAIELSVLDGLVRLSARHLQLWRADGEAQVYADHGMATGEYQGSPYSYEVDGVASAGSPRTADTAPDEEQLRQAGVTNVAPLLTTVARMQFMHGFVSSGVTATIACPQRGIRTLPSTPTDSGLLQVHGDIDGRLRVSSANDIVLERFEHIAVPKKIAEPWDPEGTRAESLAPQPRKGFDWENGDDRKEGVAAALHAGDGLAWDKRMDVERTTDTRKDIHLPEERETPPPRNDYAGEHPNTGAVDGTEQFDAYRGRTCVLRLGKDGTILLRANNGAEVFIRGDDMRLDTPGNMYINAGKSLVLQAGHDVVVRAKNSVDVSATDHDVRIKAQENLHAHSAGGVLIESASTTDGGTWPDEGGESTRHGGVVIKAAKSRVMIDASVAHISATTRIILESLDKVASALYIRVAQLLSLTQRTSMSTRNDDGGSASLRLDGASASLSGASVGLYGETSAMLTRGSEAAIISQWGKLRENPAARIAAAAASMFRGFFDADAWLGAYTTQALRDKVRFCFRKVEELKLPARFRVAVGFWAFYRRVKNGDVGAWKETPVNDTYPWPGKEHYETPGALLDLKRETNVDSASRLPKKREERTPTPGDIERKTFNEFPYRT